MSRPILLLVAIAATLAAGAWMQAATRSAPEFVPAPEPVMAAGTIAPAPVAAPTPAAHATRRTPEAPRTPATPAPAPSTAHRFESGMRIARDPATGEITMPETTGPALSIEQVQELARREAAGLVTIRNADGSETLNHEGRFTDFSVLRVGPDGRRVFRCVHGDFGVEHALGHAAPADPNLEDR